jgi:hypothetical protein
VPAADRERLPLDLSTKRLCRTAFIFDAAENCYWCQMGRRLAFWRHQSVQRRKRVIEYDRYRCKACAGCELTERCLSPKASRRYINRDRHEPLREAMDARLRSVSGKAVYRQRAPVAEGRIGVIKSRLGVRQFLLRGLENVRTEWTWLATACNLRILMRRWSSVKPRAASLG